MYLQKDTQVMDDSTGIIWTAMALGDSRYYDYHGPSIVEANGSRQYAEVDAISDAIGKVTFREVVAKEGKTTYGTGRIAVPGDVVGYGWVALKRAYDEPFADNDPTATKRP
jgi:hypothetical protein